MRRILLISILCLLAVVITDCKKAQLRTQLKGLMASTIVLPEKITCVYNGEVFPMPEELRSRPKLIVFVDSTECTTCRVSHIEMYHDLFLLAEESGLFDIMLILSNIDLSGISIIRYLSDLGIEHPVYVDVDNMFLTLNSAIPNDDRRFHSFFLDKSGYPLCFGDPVSSEEIYQVFCKTINKITP